MPDSPRTDAVIIGSGPNGLAAAIVLASEGLSVLLIEGDETVGGGMRTRELTLPGFAHDVCSAVHPLSISSPFFQSLDLQAHGVEWIQPPIALAHPFDDGTVANIKAIHGVDGIDDDTATWNAMYDHLTEHWTELIDDLLRPISIPHHPFLTVRFGKEAIRSAEKLATGRFKGKKARALFGGISAHSIMPLHQSGTAAFGLMLGTAAQAVGWPIVKNGSQRIADALTDIFLSLGGRIQTGTHVSSIEQLPKARIVIFDLNPKQIADILGPHLSNRYRNRLVNHRYGPGIFKCDWALDGPIPWQTEECLRAGTIHLGDSLAEIAASEKSAWDGKIVERPFTILAQQSLFDTTRAPAGKHTAWAYCHVPNGSDVDMTDRIEAQIERFAPGFRERILARHTMTPFDLEAYNPNYVGGDIGGGEQNLRRMLLHPLRRWKAYSIPVKGMYICSSSMPPGGGVHGMCGYYAAHMALKDICH